MTARLSGVRILSPPPEKFYIINKYESTSVSNIGSDIVWIMDRLSQIGGALCKSSFRRNYGLSNSSIVWGGIFLFRSKNISLYTDNKGLLFIIFAGISAFFIDFLALQAYSRGLSLSVGGPIIIGGSMAVAIIIGFMLGESITLMKILGISLIIVGGAVLAVVSQ